LIAVKVYGKVMAVELARQKMKNSGKCPKCSGTSVEPMGFHSNVALNFPTYYLGDMVVPKLYICTNCGYGEIWIDQEKDLSDIRKVVESSRKAQE
jgi:predicted nucleic-acid-binding Zn-ribbon protein